jgi:hypothetical protein
MVKNHRDYNYFFWLYLASPHYAKSVTDLAIRTKRDKSHKHTTTHYWATRNKI